MSTMLGTELGQGATQVRRGRPQHAVDRLASRILAFYRDNQDAMDDGVFKAPSERDLSDKLGATRHAVRNALDYLDHQGKLKRLSGRGSYLLPTAQVADPASVGTGLQCINFIQAPLFQDASLQWVVSQYLAGYTEVLEKHQVKTRFIFCGDDERDYSELLWDQVDAKNQACVLVNRMVPGLMEWLNGHDVPFVMQYARLYESESARIPHHKVYVNKIGGAAEATRHLLELGHRRIAYIGPIPGKVVLGEACNPEFEGFCSALRCEGLPIREQDLLGLQGESAAGAFEPCKQFLKQGNGFTAVVAANGGMSEGLLHAADAVGISVPDRLSVIGFSGAAPEVAARLTHVRIPQRELAHSAVELLLEVAEKKPDDFKTRIMHCELMLGETAAPPPR